MVVGLVLGWLFLLLATAAPASTTSSVVAMRSGGRNSDNGVVDAGDAGAAVAKRKNKC